MPQRQAFHLPLFVLAALALGLACSAANQERVKAGADVAEATCVVIARSQEPGAESLCATAREVVDAVAAIVAAQAARPAPPVGVAPLASPEPRDPRRELYDAVKASRAPKP